jgi:hypothetical protein
MTTKTLTLLEYQLESACKIAGCLIEKSLIPGSDTLVYYVAFDMPFKYLGWLVPIYAEEGSWIANTTGKDFPFPPVGTAFDSATEALLWIMSFRMKQLSR